VTVAVLIGVAQAVALAPGISRSGTTIFAALLLGMQRTLAARYSFYVAIPTILAATGVQALQVALGDGLRDHQLGCDGRRVRHRGAVGTAALWLVLRLLESPEVPRVLLYVWALAAVVLLTGLGRGHTG
jgi:undecaprenyl-diphosphatase